MVQHMGKDPNKSSYFPNAAPRASQVKHTPHSFSDTLLSTKHVWALWHFNWKLPSHPMVNPSQEVNKLGCLDGISINYSADKMEFIASFNIDGSSTYSHNSSVSGWIWKSCSRLRHRGMGMSFISKVSSSYVNGMFSIIDFSSRSQTPQRKRAKSLHGYFYASSLSVCWMMIFELHPAHSLLCTKFQIHRFLRDFTLMTSSPCNLLELHKDPRNLKVYC